MVATIATESSVTIVYSKPMRHGLACGTQGFVAGPVATIDAYEMNVTSRYYTSADPDFDEMWATAWYARLNADCTAVTFIFVHGIGAGSYPLRIVTVQDQAGNPLDPDPTNATVTVFDADAPRMTLVQAFDQQINIQFSEPIKKELALDPTRYRVDDGPLPRGAVVACAIPTCAVVVLRYPTAFARIPDAVTVVGLVDLAGKPFARGTETQAISLMAGQSR